MHFVHTHQENGSTIAAQQCRMSSIRLHTVWVKLSSACLTACCPATRCGCCAQFVREFAKLGLTRSVGGVLALALARELTPVVTAIILAGRVGSAFAAELGTMQVRASAWWKETAGTCQGTLAWPMSRCSRSCSCPERLGPGPSSCVQPSCSRLVLRLEQTESQQKLVCMLMYAQVSEQVDSLRVLFTDPVDYLVTPRVLASMIAGPILNVLCFCMGKCTEQSSQFDGKYTMSSSEGSMSPASLWMFAHDLRRQLPSCRQARCAPTSRLTRGLA